MPRRWTVTLRPQPPSGQACVLKREITVPRKVGTIGEFIEWYCPRSEFPRPESPPPEFPPPFILLNGARQLDPSLTTWAVRSGAQLTLQYTTPAPIPSISFALSAERRESLRIPSDRTAADVKSALLPKFGLQDALPSVLKFTFWDLELDDGELFSGLGLPASGEISVSRNEAKSIRVRLPDGSIRPFIALESDRVSGLKALIARAVSRPMRDLIVRSPAGDIDPGFLISDLEHGVELEAVLPFSPFVFESSAGPRTVALRPYATVWDARSVLAAELGLPLETVVLLTSDKARIPDSDPIATHPSPWLSCLQDMVFDFDSQCLIIPIDFDAPICRVKESVSAVISVPSAEFVLFLGDSELDKDGSFLDFEISLRDLIRIARRSDFENQGSAPPSPPDAPRPPSSSCSHSHSRAPAPAFPMRELRVILLIGIVPRRTTITIESTKTLADLLPLAAAKFEAQDLALEFASGDLNQVDLSFLPLSTRIANLADKDASEFICLREAFTIVPAPRMRHPSLLILRWTTPAWTTKWF
jgi:hypothetical protein